MIVPGLRVGLARRIIDLRPGAGGAMSLGHQDRAKVDCIAISCPLASSRAV